MITAIRSDTRRHLMSSPNSRRTISQEQRTSRPKSRSIGRTAMQHMGTERTYVNRTRKWKKLKKNWRPSDKSSLKMMTKRNGSTQFLSKLGNTQSNLKTSNMNGYVLGGESLLGHFIETVRRQGFERHRTDQSVCQSIYLSNISSFVIFSFVGCMLYIRSQKHR